MLVNLLLVAVGGALGGIARFWISGMVARRWGETFPWGTLVVNVSGATLIGIAAGLLLAPATHVIESVSLWAALVVGVLGSYTTVSSFSWQTLALVRAGEPLRAALNVAGTVLLCLICAGAGYAMTRSAAAF